MTETATRSHGDSALSVPLGASLPASRAFRPRRFAQRGRSWLDLQISAAQETLLPLLRRPSRRRKSPVACRLRCSPVELAVAAVYRRYGGSVDGEVIRLDLMARGLLEIVEERSPTTTRQEVEVQPDPSPGRTWVLLSERARPGLLLLATTRPRTGTCLRALQPACRHRPARRARRAAPVVDSARPGHSAADRSPDARRPRWRWICPASSPTWRAADRSRSARMGPWHSRPPGHGEGRAPGQGPRFPAPRTARLLSVSSCGSGGCGPRSSGMRHRRSRRGDAGCSAMPGFWQAHSWAARLAVRPPLVRWQRYPDGRANRNHADKRADRPASPGLGAGMPGPRRRSLVRPGHFIEALDALQGIPTSICPTWQLAWDPKLSGARDRRSRPGDDRQRAWWFSKEGVWYANALMVTLVTLGLVERARLGSATSAPHRLPVDRSRPRRLRCPRDRPAARAGRTPLPGDPAEFRRRRLPGSGRRPRRPGSSADRRERLGPLGPHPDVPPHPDQRVSGGRRAG